MTINKDDVGFGCLMAMLLLALLFCLSMMVDLFHTTILEERQVEVVGLYMTSPNQTKSSKVLVKWGDKTMAAELVHPLQAKYIKAGDRMTVVIRKSWIWGFELSPAVKED